MISGDLLSSCSRDVNNIRLYNDRSVESTSSSSDGSAHGDSSYQNSNSRSLGYASRTLSKNSPSPWFMGSLVSSARLAQMRGYDSKARLTRLSSSSGSLLDVRAA